ncbi:MAG: helix-turn-helix transcriptional regulator [Clostridium sp.]|nr:helix-turn-helix transcriptional regulator [Clostridium sp.]
MNNLGYKLKNLRKNLKLTQADVSNAFLSRSTLSKIEIGVLIPSLPQLEYLAQIYNVSLKDLFDDTPITPSNTPSFNIENLKNMFENQSYWKIIDKVKPKDFITNYYLGMSYYKLNIKSEAYRFLKKCETLFKKLDENNKYIYIEYLALALNSLRRIEIKNFNSPINRKYLEKILSYLTQYTNTRTEIYYITINNLAVYYGKNSQHYDTINLVEKVLTEYDHLISLKVVPHLHFNISISYFCTRNFKKAIEHIEYAVFFYSYIKDDYTAKEIQINLFNCYLYLGNFDECNKLQKKLIATNVNCRLQERFKNLKLTLLYNQGNLDELQKEISKINISNLPPLSLSDYYFIKGRLSSFQQKYKVAITYYKKCISNLKINKRYSDLYLIYKDMYIFTKNEDYKAKYLKYKELADSKDFLSLHVDITSPHCMFDKNT